MSERVELLPFVRASELAPEDKEGPGWLIEGLWVEGGVGLIGGAPKSAKSWLALEIAVSVASATPCLGRFRVERPGSVLLYAAEDAAAIVRSRLEGLVAHRGLALETLLIHVITAESLRLDLERDQRRLEQTIELLRPALLVLDPFVRLHRIDENSAGEVSFVLAYLRGLQRAFDLAVVVVHHARKNGSAESPGQTLRGSTDFHAWGDVNLYMRRRGTEELVLTIEHRCAPSPDPLGLRLCDDDPDAVHLKVVGSPPAIPVSQPPADLEAQVLAAITASHPTSLTRSALRQKLRLRNQRIGEVLGRLEAQGRIARGSSGWVLPAAQPADRPPP